LARGDIAFVQRLVDELLASHPLDPERIYAVGASNGGMFVLRLACELPSRFAAVGAVIASMPTELIHRVRPGPAVPVVLINGTKDRIMPWRGGKVARLPGLGVGGEVISVEDTVSFWRIRNRCGQPRVYRLPDPARSVEIYDFPAGCDGADLLFVKIHGGDHSWPLWRPARKSPPVGNTGRCFDATEAIWTFFSKHPARFRSNRSGHHSPIESPGGHSDDNPASHGWRILHVAPDYFRSF
jgi:polyhydroxybutyrate depolymerase